jgi:UDP-N-acetylmuramoyl-tripeptide--D-alanyl-D-alanine ligase
MRPGARGRRPGPDCHTHDVYDAYDRDVKGPATVAHRPRLDIHTLRRVLRARLGSRVAGDAGGAPAATGVAFHSGRVRPGDAFFALPGEHAHGRDFVDDALARGAAYVVSDRPHPRGIVVDDPAAALIALGREARAAWRGPIVGISGSLGKTTMKALVAAALGARSSEGNRNTTFALAGTLLDGWLEDDTERPLVLELGIDHVGEMDVLTDLVRPTHGLLTTIDAAHLEGLGDLAGVAREKSRLLAAATVARYAGAGAWDLLVPDLRSRTTRYALDAPAPPTGRYLAAAAGGVLEARTGPGDEAVRVTLPGLGAALAEHALGALLIARDLGVPLRIAASRVASATLEPRRLQPHGIGDLTLLDDSYNANLSSMRLALGVLRALPGPHAAVLGDMRELGPEAERHHALLAAACRDVTTLWAVGPLASALVQGHPSARHYPDVAAALADVADLPRAGTLLVKGSRSIGLDRLVDALLACGRSGRTAPREAS